MSGLRRPATLEMAARRPNTEQDWCSGPSSGSCGGRGVHGSSAGFHRAPELGSGMAAKTGRLEVSRRNIKKKSSQVALTAEEISVAATRYMAGAQAHQRASAWCLDKPDAKPPNIDAFFFPTVSFELILLSVEQSLRLVLLLHYLIIRADTNHTPHVLYGAIRNKSSGYEGVRSAIVEGLNKYGGTHNLPAITEKDVVSCLKEHNASYANFRYFQLSHQGRLNPNFGYSPRDVQIMHCFSVSTDSPEYG